MRELDFHKWLQAEARTRTSALTGIGDDCAVVALRKGRAGRYLLLTTDTVVAGVDFHCAALGSAPRKLAALTPAQAGRKALAVSLSDIAAMGGHPLCAVVALAVPSAIRPSTIRALYRGMANVARQFKTRIVGGDFSSTRGPAVVTTTMLGFAENAPPVTRAGARLGDLLLVTGTLGGSILRKHWAFTPRLREGVALRTNFGAKAMMDVSDGLALDLWRLAARSGVGATLFADRIPISNDALRLAKRSGLSPLEHALHDGEDFELLFALPRSSALRCSAGGLFGTRVSVIGEIDAKPGLRIRDHLGMVCPLEPRGYEHGTCHKKAQRSAKRQRKSSFNLRLRSAAP